MNFPMNFSDWLRAFLSTVSAHPVLERLFFASVEFALLVVLVWLFVRIARIKSARLMSLLWLVALAKPIVSLALGSPLPLLKVEIAKPADDQADQVAANQSPLTDRQEGVPVAGAASSGREVPDADFSFARTPDDGAFPRSVPPAEVAGLPAVAPIEASDGATANPSVPVAAPARWNAATIVISLWLAGVVFCVFRSALDRLRLCRLIRRAIRPDAALSARYAQLAAAFRVRHVPRLNVTDELESPALVGSLIPTVLIPRWLVSEQDRDKLDWALRHELMHWQLFDTHAGLVREVAQALFYFHPAVWWAGRNWEVAAELACDRAIIADDAESRDYAAQLYGMLVAVREHRRIPVKSGLFATRTQIKQRIAALVQGPCRTRAHLGAFALVAVAAISLAALSIGGTFAKKEVPADAPVASDGSAVTETAPAIAKDPETVTIEGVVRKPDGSPAAGATVRAATAMWAMLEPIVGDNFKSPMSETQADAQGRFSISFSTQPFGDLSQLGERWQDVWNRTEIAASLPGFGPAWIEYREIDLQQPVTLKLVEDVRIHGRVVDLEGRPVAGTTVKVGEPHASKDEDLSAWIEGIKAGELPWIVYRKASRSVEPRLVGTPTFVTTDASGTFEIRGLGRERFVDLTFEGEAVAHRNASAVTREMQPIRRIVSRPPFEAAEPVFGAEFTYTADPARTIEGLVRDANSGEPLANVSVESDKLVGYPYSNNRVLKTTTDKLGQFRLTGMPKGSGNRLLLVPNDEQPYFMREVDVPDPVGLGPAKMDIELHRGIWITGRVTDKATGKPVPGVRLHYLPFRSNEYAQRTPEFDSDGNVDGDQMRYVTSPDGTYRLVGLPGRAIVGAESVLQNYRRGVGYDAIEGPKFANTDHFDTYRNPIDPSPKWPSVMREINPAADAESVSLDFQLDPGQSLRIRVVDPSGQPVSGVSVTGLSEDGNGKGSHEPILVASNFGPGETRIMLFHHEQRNLGRVVTIGPEQLKSGDMTVELQPCATIVGRILNADGLPVSGMGLRLDVRPGGDFFKHLPEVATDAEGRFRVTLLPGCRYSFNGEGGGFQFVNFVKDLSIEPGETKDLGTLTIDKNGKVVPQDRPLLPQKDDAKPAEKPPVDPSSNGGKEKTGSPSAGKPSVSAEAAQLRGEGDDSTFNYAGAVVDERGRPVAGAKIEFDFWRKAAQPGDAAPAAVSDARGKFQFSRKKGDFPDRGDSLGHAYAVLIATKAGLGLAAGLSIHFETTGRLDGELSRQQRQQVDAFWPSETPVLVLVPDDVPVHGRIVNIEGQPVAGAKIEPVCIWGGKGGTLDAWDTATKKRGANYYTAGEQLREFSNGHFKSGPRSVVVPPVHTDSDGWFTLNGLGRERIAETFVSGPGIETKMIHVRTRRGEVINLPQSERSDPGKGDPVFYPAEFTHVAGPSVAVAGRVTDSRTNQPLPGIAVRANRIATNPTGGTFEAAYIRSVTDADGRYRLEGLPLGKNEFVALPPSGSRHIPAGFEVSTLAGSKPIMQDIRLAEGVRVRGRVIDGRTKKPLTGLVQYFSHSNNPHLEEAEGFARAYVPYHYWVGHDGRYEIPVLPGKGILAFNAADHEFFPRGAGADRIDAPSASPKDSPFIFSTQPTVCVADNHHLLTPLDPQPGTEELTIDLILTSGMSVSGQVLAPDGQTLSDYFILGDGYGGWNSNKRQAFEIKAYFPQAGRRLAFYHPGRNLVGQHRLSGEPPQKLEIMLRPGATLVGRVLDVDGMPLENAEIHDASLPDREMDRNLAPKDRQRGMLPPGADGRPVLTDAQGRFELKGIVPGLKYSAEVRAAMRQNGATNTIILGPIFHDVDAKSGETKNLGDLRPKQDESELDTEAQTKKTTTATKSPAAVDPPANGGKKAPATPTARALIAQRTAAGDQSKAAQSNSGEVEFGDVTGKKAKSAPQNNPPEKPAVDPGVGPAVNGGKTATASAVGAPSSVLSTQYSVLGTQSTVGNQTIAIHGRVLGPDGKPAAKAHVAAIGVRRQAGRGGDLTSNSAVLGEAITDTDGRYRLQISGVSSKTHATAQVIARTDNAGLAWKRLDPDARDVEASFKLPAEQVLRGRLVDIEGQPAANVPLSVKSVVPTQKEGVETVHGPGYYSFDEPPSAWPPALAADAAGKFAIHGIPADHGIYLESEGTDRIARQGLSINTGTSESRPQNDATYRSLVRNFKAGEEVVLPLAPAQIFEGVVRYADTNEPAPFARLTIWASQQQSSGSMISVAGKADSKGRYRINPYPGVRFGIRAYPPDGVPYLVRQITDITRKDGGLVKEVDVSLPRGVLVRGHVVESGTKKAIARAAIQYIPESFNNPNANDDIITGWQGIQPSDESGAFAIAVLPGPGRLLVNGPTGEFVAREIGYQQLERGLPGGERTYAHAIERINPAVNSDPIELTVELQRGATVAGRITNAAGELVEQALLLTRLDLHPSELTWRGFPIETLGGRFELPGLAQGVKYPAYFLDAKNRLGATLQLTADDPTPTAVLLPCGEAVATFVDKTGKPVAAFSPKLEFVLTSGTHRLDLKAMRLNSTAAEAAYVVNVDRTNYRLAPQTDAQGRVTLPALIPGARYRIITYGNGGPAILKEFVAESGKTLDLGKITVEIPKEE